MGPAGPPAGAIKLQDAPDPHLRSAADAASCSGGSDKRANPWPTMNCSPAPDVH